MILIADGGSTKAEWAIAGDDGGVRYVTTQGINPVLTDTSRMEALLRAELLPTLDVLPSMIAFYGAGCLPGEPSERLAEALHRVFGHQCSVEVNSDLVGAARAVCGRDPGIACILGTGSNSCVYDGREITANVSPLGFILGDEGSGAVLGRRLIGDVFKGQLPSDLCGKFISVYHVDRPTVIANVYRGTAPSRYLASFVPFLSDNIGRVEIYGLVYDELLRFMKRNVLSYPESRSLPIHFVGSVAFYFADVLSEVVETCGCWMGQIMRRPLPGLLNRL